MHQMVSLFRFLVLFMLSVFVHAWSGASTKTKFTSWHSRTMTCMWRKYFYVNKQTWVRLWMYSRYVCLLPHWAFASPTLWESVSRLHANASVELLLSYCCWGVSYSRWLTSSAITSSGPVLRMLITQETWTWSCYHLTDKADNIMGKKKGNSLL